MRVSFSLDLERQDSGKHKFFSRLANEFKKNGIQIKKPTEKADIFLHIMGDLEKARAKKNILRLDGLWMRKGTDYQRQNNSILKYVDKADGIVYQGKFCERAYREFLGVRPPNARCILNGASPEEFETRNPQNYFLSYGNWRPHKRLDFVVDTFKKAIDQGIDANLIIAGQKYPKGEEEHPNIKMKGWAGPSKIREWISGAIAAIHLSWVDWCPNAMVEPIVGHCPVIYTDSGGSAEVGKGVGISIKDTKWNFSPINLYSPPSLDQQEVIDALFELKNNPMWVSKPELHISNVAKQYVDFFKHTLKN
tara:strand:- start:2976 stop:3896 length:921 start_codon:yes stop_codon:yes gene_type:complete